jgi:hypothetical protein
LRLLPTVLRLLPTVLRLLPTVLRLLIGIRVAGDLGHDRLLKLRQNLTGVATRQETTWIAGSGCRLHRRAIGD